MKYVFCLMLCAFAYEACACSTASDPLVRVTECKDSLKILKYSEEEFLYISQGIKEDLNELKSSYTWKIIFGGVRKELIREVRIRGRRVYNLLRDLQSSATEESKEEFVHALEDLIITATVIKEELKE